MNNTYLMVDLSSNNGPVNLKAHWAAGFRVLALKATQGTGYTWHDTHALAAQWHAYGGIVLHYHFLTPDNGSAQADYFYTAVKGDLAVGDLFVVDVETKGDTGAEVNAFIDRVTSHDKRGGLIYGSPSFLRDNGIRKHAGWKLWLAQYGPKAEVPPSWLTWAIWQYTDHAAASGVTGAVDMSHVKPWLLRPMLHERDQTWPVLVVKQRLKALGYGGMVMNDRYGPGMRRAVAKFKRDRKLASRDGSVCGATFWGALYK
jgi:GH25 family lysozyme M1 (1,4-beta-N-acetylmuramidase)